MSIDLKITRACGQFFKTFALFMPFNLNLGRDMAKTQEEIAFEMLSKLKGLGVWGEGNKDEILDLFAECLIAAKGERRVKGLEAHKPAPALQPGFVQTPLPDPRVQQPQTAPQAAPLQQAAPSNPVHQQQQQVAQAYQPVQGQAQR